MDELLAQIAKLVRIAHNRADLAHQTSVGRQVTVLGTPDVRIYGADMHFGEPGQLRVVLTVRAPVYTTTVSASCLVLL